MESLETWEVSGDQKTMDYYRCYSTDYPHVETLIHENNTMLTLYFNSLARRTNCTLTFSLTPLDLVKERAVA